MNRATPNEQKLRASLPPMRKRRHPVRIKRTLTPAARMLEGIRRRAAERNYLRYFPLRQTYAMAMAGPRNSAKQHMQYIRAVARSPRIREALYHALREGLVGQLTGAPVDGAAPP